MIRVVMPHAVFGLVVRTDGTGSPVVVDAAPMARWSVGRDAREVWRYWRRRGAVLEWYPDGAASMAPTAP